MKCLPPLCRRFTFLGLAAGVALLAPGAVSAADFASVIPGKSVAAVWLKDRTEAEKKFRATKGGQFFFGEDMKNFRIKLEEIWKKGLGAIQAEEGIDVQALLDEVQGGIAFVLAETGERDGDFAANMFLILEAKPERHGALSEAMDKLVAKSEARIDKSSYQASGVEVRSIKFTTDVPADGADGAAGLMKQESKVLEYAFAKDFLVLSFVDIGEQPIKAVLANIAAPGGADSLAMHEGFKKANAERGAGAETPDMTGFFDYTRLLAQAESEMPAEAKAVFTSLGIAGSGPVLLAANLHPGGSTTTITLPTPTEKKGLFNFFYGAGTNSLARLSEVPAEATNATTWNLDLGILFAEIRKGLNAAQPQFGGMLDMQLNAFKSQNKVDLQADVIERIKGEHLFYTVPSADSATITDPTELQVATARTLVLGLGADGGDKVGASLDSLLTQFAQAQGQELPFEKTEQQGFAIYGQKEDPNMQLPVTPQVAFTPKSIYITLDPPNMGEALRRVSGKGKGGSIAEHPALAKFLAGATKEHLLAFGFTREEHQINAMKTQLQSARAGIEEAMGRGEIDAPFQPGDFVELLNALPPAEKFAGHIGDQFTAVYTRPSAMHILFEGRYRD